MHSAPVYGAAGGNDLEFIVARQRLLRSSNNVRAAHHASNVALVCERDGDNRGRRGLHTGGDGVRELRQRVCLISH